MSEHAPAERDEDQRRALQVALQRAGLTVEALWLRYFAVGGVAGPLEVEGWLEGLLELPDVERDVLAVAANERLDELAGTLRVPHSRPLRQARPRRGPLAALVTLLEQEQLDAGGGLVAAAEAAGRALGVELVVHLVDDEQRELIPVVAPGQGRAACVSVDGSLAGKAYQVGRLQSGAAGDHPVLWFPLLEGPRRLGVLQVLLDDPAGLRDPLLHQHCGWVAALLGHLVVAADRRGDDVLPVRTHHPRTVAAELVWNLLPPLTAGDERFQLSGLVEPAHSVGGDVFDHALSGRRADLAVVDATGHDLGAGLVASAVLAAYRVARRAGHGLYAQAAAIDEVVAEHVTPATATGVLASLDLASGRLRYVVAGHAAPLVLRDGHVVASLEAGRRAAFGRGTGELSVGEHVLQPGDALVLYTDGVVEARDPRGEAFGLPRLVDLLERAAAGGHSPPETVRRLVHAVLRHQDDVLQDDATVLLARWSGPARPSPTGDGRP